MTNIMEKLPQDSIGMEDAWLGCLAWSVRSKEPDFLAVFRAEVGLPPAAKTPLEQMIDEAIMPPDIAERYVEWFNAKVWGPVNG